AGHPRRVRCQRAAWPVARLAGGGRAAGPVRPADPGYGLLRRQRQQQPGPSVLLLAGRPPAGPDRVQPPARRAVLPAPPPASSVTADSAATAVPPRGGDPPSPPESPAGDRAEFLDQVCGLLWPPPASAVPSRGGARGLFVPP